MDFPIIFTRDMLKERGSVQNIVKKDSMGFSFE